MTDDTSREARVRALGRDAWDQGQAALGAGDSSRALHWLDRANRLAPNNPLFRLALATAALAADPAHAATLFAELAEKQDVREVWLGLASARWRGGAGDRAAEALSDALSRHVAPADNEWMALADQIAPTGWCTVGTAGTLLWGGSGKVSVALDGRPVRLRPTGELPRGWRSGGLLRVTRDGHELLGSPIDIRALRRMAAYVAWEDGAIQGWAWYPADPDRIPELLIVPEKGRPHRLVAGAVPVPMPDGQLLARPRGFRCAMPEQVGPFKFTDSDGNELPGSPVGSLAPGPIAAARRPPAKVPSRRRVTIIIPVYADHASTLACLQSVLAAGPRGVRVLVIDDATPEPALAAMLDGFAARGKIQLLRHAVNKGFPASANAGFAAAAGCDVLLLNSDTLVAPGVVRLLQDAVYGAPNIATACPLSNDATILSYPDAAARNPMPDLAETTRLSALAQGANGARTVPIPTPVGFCMFIRHDALAATGGFRADIFGPGYGEENDFAQRAGDAGWRHVAAPGVFVAHRGEASFGAQANTLRGRAQRILARLHPTYDAQIAAHIAADPLAAARQRLDLARWRAARKDRSRAVLLITHAHGGGVEKTVAARVADLQRDDIRPILLRPSAPPAQAGAWVHLDNGTKQYPNLRFRLPAALPSLVRLLRAERVARVEIHHMLGHPAESWTLPRLLDVPHDVVVHDYAWFCPRIVLSGGDGRYCGEPDPAGCDACVNTNGSRLDPSLSVSQIRERAASLLRGAARVSTASNDAVIRMRRHFPGLRLNEQPPTDDAAESVVRPPAPNGRARHIAVIGAIGPEKGFEVLLAVARDAAERRLALRFTLIGHSTDDAVLLATERIFVTGPYQPEEIYGLIRRHRADLAFLPSLVPETWCHSLTEVWEAGLGAVVFDIGAQADRVRRTGRGLVLPLGLPPAAINDVLLAARW